MAQIFTVNVYEIDGNAIKGGPRSQGFPSANVGIRSYVQGADGNNASLNGIIETAVFGKPQKFGVIQTVSALATLANA